MENKGNCYKLFHGGYNPSSSLGDAPDEDTDDLVISKSGIKELDEEDEFYRTYDGKRPLTEEEIERYGTRPVSYKNHETYKKLCRIGYVGW